jgi:hypothetical protein
MHCITNQSYSKILFDRAFAMAPACRSLPNVLREEPFFSFKKIEELEPF